MKIGLVYEPASNQSKETQKNECHEHVVCTPSPREKFSQENDLISWHQIVVEELIPFVRDEDRREVSNQILGSEDTSDEVGTETVGVTRVRPPERVATLQNVRDVNDEFEAAMLPDGALGKYVHVV
jgi:hypothetical protein